MCEMSTRQDPIYNPVATQSRLAHVLAAGERHQPTKPSPLLQKSEPLAATAAPVSSSPDKQLLDYANTNLSLAQRAIGTMKSKNKVLEDTVTSLRAELQTATKQLSESRLAHGKVVESLSTSERERESLSNELAVSKRETTTGCAPPIEGYQESTDGVEELVSLRAKVAELELAVQERDAALAATMVSMHRSTEAMAEQASLLGELVDQAQSEATTELDVSTEAEVDSSVEVAPAAELASTEAMAPVMEVEVATAAHAEPEFPSEAETQAVLAAAAETPMVETALDVAATEAKVDPQIPRFST